MHHSHDMMSVDFSLWHIILFGFTMSFGHCIGMCSGIVVAYSSAKLQGASRFRQISAHILYAFGRISSYAILGLIAGSIGYALTPTDNAKGIFFAFLGAILIAIGLSIFFAPRFLAIIESSALVRSAWYKRFFGAMIASKNMASFCAIGILNGLIPCGMVYAAIAMALNAPNAISAAGAMALFGVATVPSLFAIGLFAGTLLSFRFRGIITKISAIFVCIMGAMTLYRAVSILTS
ncbi:MAG: sulfite exporter TauE/SafE family protein [Helicobacteraceae bacterium]|nr:sulfite exporter TauE/SafE family protein [Helicobacteraceae bacterium]